LRFGKKRIISVGERGPQRLSTEQLEQRGSWRAKERRKEEKAAAAPEKPKRDIPPPIDRETLGDVIKQIPGYDPYRGAEDYRFDEDAAGDAIDFIQQKLCHVKGELAGKPFILEIWEQAIIANLFGWKHKETGFRRYQECLIFVPRKNGKTPLCATIILYCLFEDQEPGAEIYGAASEYKQAGFVFTHAWGMVRQEPELEQRCKVFKGQSKAIEVGQPGDIDYGIYRVICADADPAHGFLTHVAVVDELHKQPNGDLVDALWTSTAGRRQPLLVYITTSDFEREGSICNEKEDYAIQVRDGIIDEPKFLPVIYKAEIEDDWTDEKVWEKANPNIDVSVSREYLRTACKRAQDTPTFENEFKRLHLNIRTQQDVRWIPMDKWNACGGPVAAETLAGRVCYGGLDLSTTTDISAFVLAFGVDDKVLLLPKFWLPRESAKKRQDRDRVPYLTWANQGLITLTEGNVVDYDIVRRDINELGKLYKIKDIAIDRWNAAQITTQLGGDGFEIVSFGQGYQSMSGPSKEFEKLLIDGGLVHGGNPVLKWMASNVAAEIDAAGNIKPSKKKSTERIDGIVAAIMAIARWAASPEPKASVYEERGVLAF
jgi:phage terminase large subunit-like protein